MLEKPLVVRAESELPPMVLKIAHGTSRALVARPACWNASPVNVVRNSSEWPGSYTLASQFGGVPSHVPTRAPSTVSFPSATVTDPPTPYDTLIQSAGSAVP